mgnify:CR=1 FL=1
MADVTPPEQRAGRMGLIGAAFGLGFIVGPGLGGLLTQPQLGRLGYQLPIFLAAALAAVAAVGVVVFLRESRAKADPAAPRPAFLAGLKDARDNAVVSRVLVVTLIYMAGFSAMESVFGLWSESRYQWGAREVGLSFMIVGIVSTLNQGFFAGRLARRFGESRVLATGMLLFGTSLVLQVLAPVAWFPATRLELGALTIPVVQGWIIPIVMAIGACGMSLAMPNISAMISRASPPRSSRCSGGTRSRAAGHSRTLLVHVDVGLGRRARMRHRPLPRRADEPVVPINSARQDGSRTGSTVADLGSGASAATATSRCACCSTSPRTPTSA